MYGGEVALRIYMDAVAFQEGLEEVWTQEQTGLVTREVFVSTGVTGAFTRIMPTYDNNAAVASVYAEVAWRHGWLLVDRCVSDEEYDRLNPAGDHWKNRDYQLTDIDREFGTPSIRFGGSNHRFPHTIAYAPPTRDRGLICLHFASIHNDKALGTGADPESPVLLAVRRETPGPFWESFTFTPAGIAFQRAQHDRDEHDSQAM